MIIVTTDGEQFAGIDAEAIVRSMRDTEWNAPERKRAYMVEVADRVYDMTGVEIPNPESITAKMFLDYLVQAELIRIVE